MSETLYPIWPRGAWLRPMTFGIPCLLLDHREAVLAHIRPLSDRGTTLSIDHDHDHDEGTGDGSLSHVTLLWVQGTEGTMLLVCVDAESDDRVDRAACRHLGLRSMVVVPLRFDQTHVGVLMAASMYFSTRLDSDELFRRATHDALTGLPNRALFMDRLRTVADARMYARQACTQTVA